MCSILKQVAVSVKRATRAGAIFKWQKFLNLAAQV